MTKHSKQLLYTIGILMMVTYVMDATVEAVLISAITLCFMEGIVNI